MYDSRVLVLMPVYNDWDACTIQLNRLEDALQANDIYAEVLLIDDGSVDPAPPNREEFHYLERISVLELKQNVGHQRAICLGLCYADAHLEYDVVVVMDSDGEDAATDVPRLLEEFERLGGSTIVFAERRKRSESLLFCCCYFAYRLVHHLLTGYRVRVGNFSVLPAKAVHRLVLVPAMWSHYAAAVFTSRLTYATLPTCRAKRLDGQSKMNFLSLVIHGLTAISVFSERVGVRLLLACLTLSVLIGGGIATVFCIRTLTPWAIPGWATFTCGLLLIILFQCLISALLFCFMILSGRNRLDFLPARDFSFFVSRQRVIHSSQHLQWQASPHE